MLKRASRAALFMYIAAIIFLALPGAGLAVEFTADLEVKTKGDGEMAGKISIKGDKVRQEWSEEGESQVMIVRPDKSVTWMITPQEKTYMEIPFDPESRGFEEWSPEMEQKATLLGEETVAGQSCKKYELTEDGEKVTFWVSKKYPFPIRVEDSESVMEYKNIKEGSLPDSIFELPDGYEKMGMPMIPPLDQNPPEE